MAKKEKDQSQAQEKEFQYPDRKVSIEVINRKRTTAILEADNSTEGVLLTGATLTFGLPQTRSGFVNPFLIYAEKEGVANKREFAEEVQARLEYDLGLEEGALNVNILSSEKLNESPWVLPEYKVRLHKATKLLSSATLKLDLSQATDFLRYLIALASPRCANNWSKRFDSNEYEVTLREEGLDRNEEANTLEKQHAVISFFYNLRQKGGVEAKNVFYTVYNLLLLRDAQYKPTRWLNSSSPIEDFYIELSAVNERRGGAGKLHDIIKSDDSKIQDYLLFFKAKEKAFIHQVGDIYQDKTGKEIGRSIEAVISYLNSPERVPIKNALKE